MMTNLIIGAGQLGSRHLQGLLKYKKEQVIYVLDKSENSLKISKNRAEEIEFKHMVKYVTKWNYIPNELDLVIIATGANVRSKLTIKLLSNHKVKTLVLEKILFQDIQSYFKVSKIIKETKTPTYVNHPRRMFAHYIDIKNKLSIKKEEINFHVFGSNWGLACNALHFIDLFSFLSNSKLLDIDFSRIDEKIISSKRVNCIEFTGLLSGRLENGNNFNITSLDGDYKDITVCIFTKSKRWILQEGDAQKIIYLNEENNFNETVLSYKNEFQSDLTTSIINDVILEHIRLPNFEEACNSHIPFVEGALKFYNRINNSNNLVCPIT